MTEIQEEETKDIENTPHEKSAAKQKRDLLEEVNVEDKQITFVSPHGSDDEHPKSMHSS